ncbi:MAG: hypothetical protein ACTSUK_01710, partial [Promethearchaeota archaeon]
MSTNCVPDKDQRKKIIQNAIENLSGAIFFLEKAKKNLDKDPVLIENAVKSLRGALGCDFPNKEENYP